MSNKFSINDIVKIKDTELTGQIVSRHLCLMTDDLYDIITACGLELIKVEGDRLELVDNSIKFHSISIVVSNYKNTVKIEASTVDDKMLSQSHANELLNKLSEMRLKGE